LAPSLDLRTLDKPMRQFLEAYDKLCDEAKPLTEAMDIVSERLRLMRVPDDGSGAVHTALAGHPGALESIVSKLVARIEQYLDESRALHSRYRVQNGSALTRCRQSVQLWINRREVGSNNLGKMNADDDEDSDDQLSICEGVLAAHAVLKASLAADSFLGVGRYGG